MTCGAIGDTQSCAACGAEAMPGEHERMHGSFSVGDRVTHLDMLAQNGTTLPMVGTVVGIKVEFLVEWDGAEPSPVSGWTPSSYYPADVLHRPLDNA